MSNSQYHYLNNTNPSHVCAEISETNANVFNPWTMAKLYHDSKSLSLPELSVPYWGGLVRSPLRSLRMPPPPAMAVRISVSDCKFLMP